MYINNLWKTITPLRAVHKYSPIFPFTSVIRKLGQIGEPFLKRPPKNTATQVFHPSFMPSWVKPSKIIPAPLDQKSKTWAFRLILNNYKKPIDTILYIV